MRAVAAVVAVALVVLPPTLGVVTCRSTSDFNAVAASRAIPGFIAITASSTTTVLTGTAASAALAAGVRPSSKPTTAPLDPRLLRARELAREGRVGQVARGAEPRLRELLDNIAAANPDELILLASLREFGRYFERVRGQLAPGQVDTLAWLPAQPRLFPVLMMNATTGDPPDRVLEVLRLLRADFRLQLDDHAELAAATALVWDAPERFGGAGGAAAGDEEVKVDPAVVAGVFRHFLTGARQLRFDPRKTPAELLVYVVDVSLGEEELRWATGRYGPRADVAATFFDVPYRPGATYDRDRDFLTEQSYVLPNLLRRGGACADAAYFASQVAKAAGVPSAPCRAAASVGAGDGEQPAWVAYLQPRAGGGGGGGGGGAAWNVARYPEHGGWPGEVVDPQTYETLPDAEVAVIAGLAGTTPRDRQASVALHKVIDLVPQEDRPAMLARSAELSPCNRRPWFDLADLASAQKLTEAQVKTMEEMVQKHLARPYPQFAVEVRLRMIKERAPDQYAAEVKRLAAAFPDRPEIAAQVKLAGIDRDIEAARRTAAVEQLIDLLRRHGQSGPVLLAAVSRLDPLLRKLEDLPKLEAVYRELFNAMPRPSPRRHARTTPYYRIAQRYADLLDETKQPQAAQAVRTKMQNTLLPE